MPNYGLQALATFLSDTTKIKSLNRPAPDVSPGLFKVLADITIPEYYIITIEVGQELIIPEGRTITNFGYIINSGTVINNGILDITNGALTNNKLIKNNGTINFSDKSKYISNISNLSGFGDILGNLITISQDWLLKNNIISSTGESDEYKFNGNYRLQTFFNLVIRSGIRLVIPDGCEIVISGVLTSYGGITNNGRLINIKSITSYGPFINNNYLQNNNSITIFGSFLNNNYLENNIQGGMSVDYSKASFENKGTFTGKKIVGYNWLSGRLTSGVNYEKLVTIPSFMEFTIAGDDYVIETLRVDGKLIISTSVFILQSLVNTGTIEVHTGLFQLKDGLTQNQTTLDELLYRLNFRIYYPAFYRKYFNYNTNFTNNGAIYSVGNGIIQASTTFESTNPVINNSWLGVTNSMNKIVEPPLTFANLLKRSIYINSNVTATLSYLKINSGVELVVNGRLNNDSDSVNLMAGGTVIINGEVTGYPLIYKLRNIPSTNFSSINGSTYVIKEYAIQKNCHLILDSGVTLVIPNNVTFTNFGKIIINDATLNINGTFVNNSIGVFEVSGTAILNINGTLMNNNGQILNNGIITGFDKIKGNVINRISSLKYKNLLTINLTLKTFTLINDYILTDDIVIDDGMTLIIPYRTTLTVFGKITINGNGTLDIRGTLINNGSINGGNIIGNNITNTLDSLVFNGYTTRSANVYTLTINYTLQPKNTLLIAPAQLLVIPSSVKFDNLGTINNTGELNNFGIINTTSSLNNYLYLRNYGSIIGKGDITNTVKLYNFDLIAPSEVTSTTKINNSGEIINEGNQITWPVQGTPITSQFLAISSFSVNNIFSISGGIYTLARNLEISRNTTLKIDVPLIIASGVLLMTFTDIRNENVLTNNGLIVTSGIINNVNGGRFSGDSLYKIIELRSIKSLMRVISETSYSLLTEYTIPANNVLFVNENETLLIRPESNGASFGKIINNGFIYNKGKIINESSVMLLPKWGNKIEHTFNYLINSDNVTSTGKDKFTLNKDFTLPEGALLDIPSGIEFSVTNFTLTNNGLIRNNANFYISRPLAGSGTMVGNNFTMTLLYLVLSNFATSSGAVTTLIKGYVLPKSVYLVIQSGETLRMAPNVSFTNDSLIVGSGSLSGDIRNNGSITVNGNYYEIITLDDLIKFGVAAYDDTGRTLLFTKNFKSGVRHKLVISQGQVLKIPLDYTFTNAGAILNYGTLAVEGLYVENGSYNGNSIQLKLKHLLSIGKASNYGYTYSLIKSFEVNNGTTLVIDDHETFMTGNNTLTNNGIITNNGQLSNGGTFINTGIVNGSGQTNGNVPFITLLSLLIAKVAITDGRGNYRLTNDYIVSPINKLLIENYATLTVNSGITLTNNSIIEIQNNGSLLNDDGALTNNGSITGSGKVQGFEIRMSLSGLYSVKVITRTSDKDFQLKEDFTIQDGTTLTIESKETLTVPAGKTLTIIGKLVVNGNLVNNNVVVSNGTLTNAGEIVNNNSIELNGNYYGDGKISGTSIGIKVYLSTLVNIGAALVNGNTYSLKTEYTLPQGCMLFVPSGKVFQNSYLLINNGRISNEGTIINFTTFINNNIYGGNGTITGNKPYVTLESLKNNNIVTYTDNKYRLTANFTPSEDFIFEIGQSQELVLSSTLTIGTNNTLSIKGTITNNGTIIANGKLVIASTATLNANKIQISLTRLINDEKVMTLVDNTYRLDCNYTIYPYFTLIIPTGKTMLIPSGITLINNGEVSNNGTLTINGNYIGNGSIIGNDVPVNISIIPSTNLQTVGDVSTLVIGYTIPSKLILSLDTGKTLIIPQGVTLTINGRIINNGIIKKNGELVINGSISGNQPVSYLDYMLPNVTISGKQYTLTANSTIPASTTITINADETLIISKDVTLTVNGRILNAGTIKRNGDITNISGTTLSGNNVIVDLPSLLDKQILSKTSNTYTLLSNFTIPALHSLIIANTETLVLPVGKILTNNGTISNSGNIDLYTSIQGSGTLTGNQPVSYLDYMLPNVTVSGKQYTLTKNFTIQASTNLKINADETLIISQGVTLTINGKLLNNGRIKKNGEVVISGNGSITGDPPISYLDYMLPSVTVSGKQYTLPSGTTFVVPSTTIIRIYSDETLIISKGASLIINGKILNAGTIKGNGEILINGTLSENNIIVDLPSLLDKQILSKNVNTYTLLNNNLTIPARHSLIIANTETLVVPIGNTLTNNGTIENNGTITINGSFKGTVNVTGNVVELTLPVLVSSGFATTSRANYFLINNFTIQPFIRVLVRNGETLELAADKTLIVNGYLSSTGTFVLKGILTALPDRLTLTGEFVYTLDFVVSNNFATLSSGNVYTLTKDFTIPPKTSIPIDNGQTLIIPSGKTLTNDNSLVNNGTVTIQGTYKGIGNLTNNGTTTIANNATYTGTGSLTNTGTLTNNGTYTATGNLLNSGTVTIGNNASYTTSGSVTNNSILTNNGTYTGTGSLTNSGTLTNNGTYNGTGSLTNNGTVNNNNIMSPQIVITGNNVLTTLQTLLNTGVIGQTPSNYDLQNNHTILPKYSLLIASGQLLKIPQNKTIVNNGTLINNGSVENAGALENNGTITGTNFTGNRTIIYLPWLVTQSVFSKTNNDYTLLLDYTLTNLRLIIKPGEKLFIPSGKRLENLGDIVNNGIIERRGELNLVANSGVRFEGNPVYTYLSGVPDKVRLEGSDYVFIDSVVIDSYLNIIIESGQTLKLRLGKTLDINGKLTINSGGTFKQNGNIRNNGEIINNNGTVNGNGKYEGTGTFTGSPFVMDLPTLYENSLVGIIDIVNNKYCFEPTLFGTIPKNYKLSIANGETFIIRATHNIIINGGLDNNGTIQNDGNINNNGLIDSYGIVTGNKIKFSLEGLFSTNMIAKTGTKFYTKQDLTINNVSNLIIGVSEVLDVHSGTVLTIRGRLEQYGNLTNNGTIQNSSDEIIVYSGEYSSRRDGVLGANVKYTLNKLGLLIPAIVKTNNTYVLDNTSSEVTKSISIFIQNGETLQINKNATLTILGSIINNGTLINNGTTNNSYGGTYSGSGTLTGNKIILKIIEAIPDVITSTAPGDYTIQSNYTIPLQYSLTVDPAIKVTVAPGKTLTNNGTILVNGRFILMGTITNTGTITIQGEYTKDATGVVNDNYIQLTLDGLKARNYAETLADGSYSVIDDTVTLNNFSVLIKPSEVLTIPKNKRLVVNGGVTNNGVINNLGILTISEGYIGSGELNGNMVTITDNGLARYSRELEIFDVASDYFTLKKNYTIPKNINLEIDKFSTQFGVISGTTLSVLTVNGRLTVRRSQISNMSTIVNNGEVFLYSGYSGIFSGNPAILTLTGLLRDNACTVQDTNSYTLSIPYTIDTYFTLIIDSGEHLIIGRNLTYLTVKGKLINNGRMTLDHILDNQGTVINNGIVSNSYGGNSLIRFHNKNTYTSTGDHLGDYAYMTLSEISTNLPSVIMKSDNTYIVAEDYTVPRHCNIIMEVNENLIVNTGKKLSIFGKITNKNIITNNGTIKIYGNLQDEYTPTFYVNPGVTNNTDIYLGEPITPDRHTAGPNSKIIMTIEMLLYKGKINSNFELVSNLTVPSGYTLRIDAGETITIAAGKTLILSANSKLEMNGTLINNGTLTSNIVTTIPGTLTNNGTLTSTSTITIPGTLTNNGTLTSTGAITIPGTLTNNGTLTSTSVVNNGTVYNNKNWNGNMTGNEGITLLSGLKTSGVATEITKTYTLETSFIVLPNFKLTINNDEKLIIKTGSTLTNRAKITCDGSITNNGVLDNYSIITGDDNISGNLINTYFDSLIALEVIRITYPIPTQFIFTKNHTIKSNTKLFITPPNIGAPYGFRSEIIIPQDITLINNGSMINDGSVLVGGILRNSFIIYGKFINNSILNSSPPNQAPYVVKKKTTYVNGQPVIGEYSTSAIQTTLSALAANGHITLLEPGIYSIDSNVDLVGYQLTVGLGETLTINRDKTLTIQATLNNLGKIIVNGDLLFNNTDSNSFISASLSGNPVEVSVTTLLNKGILSRNGTDYYIEQNYTLQRNWLLTIPATVKIIIPFDKSLTNYGTIDNNGTIVNNGTYTGDGKVLNNKIQTNLQGLLDSLTVSKTGNVYTFLKNYTIPPFCTLTVEDTETLIIPSGPINSSPFILTVNGTLINNNIIQNLGVISSTGAIINNSTLTVNGTIISDGTLTNDDTIDGTGTITSGNGLVDGTGTSIDISLDKAKLISNNIFTQLTDTYILVTDFTIPLDCVLSIETGKRLIIQSGITLTNNGKIVNNGTLTNSGTIDGTGVLTGTSVVNGRSTPSVPRNLRSSVVTSTSFTLSWAAPSENNGSNLTGYVIISKPELNPKPSQILNTATSINLTGLQPKTIYEIFLVPTSNYGDGTSASIIVKTYGPPDEPADFKSDVISDTSASLSWIKPENNGDELKFYTLTPDPLISPQPTISISAVDKTLVGLTPKTTYSIKLAGRNNYGLGNENLTTFTTYGPPEAVQDFTIMDVKPTAIDLKWSEPILNGSTLSEYIITVTPSIAGSPFSFVNTTATITGLTTNTTYTITLKANSNYGEGLPVSLTSTPGSVPSAVTNLKTDVITQNSITISWTKPVLNGSTLSGYYISLQPPVTNLPPIISSYTSYTIPGLASKTVYSIMLAPISNNGQGPTATLSNLKTFGPPDAITAFNTSTKTATTIGLSWTPPVISLPQILQNYVITVTPSITTLPIIGGAARTTTITGLTVNKSYTVTLTPTSNFGNGPISSLITSTAGNPKAITNFKTVAKTATTIDLSWTKPDENGSALVNYVITVTPSIKTLPIIGGGATTTKLTGLTANTKYAIKLTPKNAIGQGPVSILSETTSNVPNVITNFRATSNLTTSIDLSWTRPISNGIPLGDYVITVKPSIKTLPKISGLAQTTKLTGLSASAKYTVTLRANSSVGLGPITTLTIGGPPNVVTNFKTVTKTATTIDLSWTSPISNGISLGDYVITVTPSIKTLPKIIPSATKTKLTGLTAKTKYTITLRAKNSAGLSAVSSVIETTFGSPNAVATPTSTAKTKNTISVRWTAPTSVNATIDSYTVYVKNGTQIIQTIPKIKTTNLVITKLIPAVRYSIGVSATNKYGTSVATNFLGVTTPLI